MVALLKRRETHKLRGVVSCGEREREYVKRLFLCKVGTFRGVDSCKAKNCDNGGL
jgi:hypothetical protein